MIQAALPQGQEQDIPAPVISARRQWQDHLSSPLPRITETNGLERAMKRWISLLAITAIFAGCGETPSKKPVAQTSAAPAQAPQTKAPAKTYDELLSLAEEQVKARKLNNAVKILTQAIAQEPNRADAYVRRAAICSEANLLTQAIADMSSAIKTAPQNAKFLNTRGYFLLLSKQYGRAESDFSDAIGLDLEYAQPYNNRGLVWVAQGKYEQAIKDFDNALKAKPDYLDAHNNRGFALLQLDRAEEAVAAFSKVLELDPKYINALTNRARAHLKLNHPVNAIADYTTVIGLVPDAPQHYSARAEAYLADGNQAAATRDLEHVDWLNTLSDLNIRIIRTPRDADVWASRGEHLLLENRFAEAEKSFQNALALVPGHLPALNGRARLSLENGDYKAAVADCTEVLQHEFRYETLSVRGDAQFALGNYGDAIADYEAARRFDERVVDAYRKRAAQLREKGDEALAKADENFAAGLEKRLTDAVAIDKSAPREMVIEQASFETPAPQAAKPAPEMK